MSIQCRANEQSKIERKNDARLDRQDLSVSSDLLLLFLPHALRAGVAYPPTNSTEAESNLEAYTLSVKRVDLPGSVQPKNIQQLDRVDRYICSALRKYICTGTCGKDPIRKR